MPKAIFILIIIFTLLLKNSNQINTKPFNGGFLKSFIQQTKSVIIGKYTMSSEQVPHYFLCNEPFRLSLNKCLTAFPCKMIQGKNTSGKVIKTWECHNGIPPAWYVKKKQLIYSKCVDISLQENKRCLIEKTLTINESWPKPQTEKIDMMKNWPGESMSKYDIRKMAKKANSPKGRLNLEKKKKELMVKYKKFKIQQKNRKKVSKIIERLGLNTQG